MRRGRKMLESGRSGERGGEGGPTPPRPGPRPPRSSGEVQGARHRAQQAQFKLAAAEGATMAEIARGWGVSRQLVSRMVKEPMPRRRKG